MKGGLDFRTRIHGDDVFRVHYTLNTPPEGAPPCALWNALIVQLNSALLCEKKGRCLHVMGEGLLCRIARLSCAFW